MRPLEHIEDQTVLATGYLDTWQHGTDDTAILLKHIDVLDYQSKKPAAPRLDLTFRRLLLFSQCVSDSRAPEPLMMRSTVLQNRENRVLRNINLLLLLREMSILLILSEQWFQSI